mmetsp:Transcript_22716/g.25284  ORF Transcript_22716/g.25284 Transcript_22716/m.25284 type:complete len:215 (+) Transcript_22716:58-702(+)
MELVDYNECEAIASDKTVSFLNTFIINTTQFLNRFSNICEQKLNKVGRKIQRLEITVALLEAKLASIGDIEGVAAATTEAPPAAPAAPGAEQNGEAPTDPDVPTGDIPLPPPMEGEGDAPGGDEGGVTWEDDPRYTKFFKMLKMGVPLAHVQSKMMMEGYDPSNLENPKGKSDYVPGAAAPSEQSSDEESDFSSDDESDDSVAESSENSDGDWD